jgi:phosphatidylglycerol:prolipoprotein diacylglycerol transferase
MPFSQNKIPKLTPAQLAILIGVISSFLAIILFYPLSQVFAGEWKLHQQIDIAKQVAIDLRQLGLSSLANNSPLSPVIPIGTISLRYYAIFMFLGLVSGYFLSLYLARFNYIAGTVIDRLVVGLIIFGLLGARLFFVAFHWDIYQDNWPQIFLGTTSGGLAIFGAILFGLFYIWLYCVRFKFNFYEFLDVLAPGLLLGQVIGRWGNFFNYEAYGPPTSVFWRMFVPETANYYNFTANYFHPTFLYEIIPNLLLLIFILANYLKLTHKRSGLVFATYAIGYGLIRFFTEFYRLDALKLHLPEWLHVSVPYVGTFEALLASQLAAAGLFISGVVIWMRRRHVIYLKRSMQEYHT